MARGRPLRSLLLAAVALSVLGFVASMAVPASGDSVGSLAPGPTLGSTAPVGVSATDLCTSGGPTILGVEWNCVAILNLTELALMLVSVGIVAWVFWDEEKAELPGESVAVPLTSEEWTRYREDRRRGVPYEPSEPDEGDEGA